MTICNPTGCGKCVGCAGIPPKMNGISYGDICIKVVQNIIDCLQDGDLYRFDGEKLYRVTINDCQFYEDEDCNVRNIDIS